MRGIAVLGSTGSIGKNTLSVIETLGDYKVVSVSAGKNIELLAEQIIRFQPKIAVCETEAGAKELSERLTDAAITTIPEILWGEAGMVAAATCPEVETVVSATVGAVGFIPTLRAIEAGKRIALANKETLVIGGELIIKTAAETGSKILPIDSEHNAIHQCLRGEQKSDISRLILTASGGPFLRTPIEHLSSVTRDQALAHPNWKMGEKITIDSATLMNKGLEVIEARWLFGIEPERINVVIHPQSIIHSMVEFCDGSIIAQLGAADMRHAIQYALTYPERRPVCNKRLDLLEVSALTFDKPEKDRFPCLWLAYKALAIGGTAPAVLNAVNEVTVRAFLDEKIQFQDIAAINESILNEHLPKPGDSVETLLEADRWARKRAIMEIENILGNMRLCSTAL
ncbi:MAG TPA: 1-deoxy-D-xylulose-5-phosphate reductoisomerase [Pyrinomonadaceae bacterium]|nr:1-deoxy-D-xylulose-5-phosphate reductoisomerase [Pyrinomonadaceae bacterium]